MAIANYICLANYSYIGSNTRTVAMVRGDYLAIAGDWLTPSNCQLHTQIPECIPFKLCSSSKHFILWV